MGREILKALDDAIDKDLEKYHNGLDQEGDNYKHVGTPVKIEVNGISVEIELTPDFYTDLTVAITRELLEVEKNETN